MRVAGGGAVSCWPSAVELLGPVCQASFSGLSAQTGGGPPFMNPFLPGLAVGLGFGALAEVARNSLTSEAKPKSKNWGEGGGGVPRGLLRCTLRGRGGASTQPLHHAVPVHFSHRLQVDFPIPHSKIQLQSA